MEGQSGAQGQVSRGGADLGVDAIPGVARGGQGSRNRGRGLRNAGKGVYWPPHSRFDCDGLPGV